MKAFYFPSVPESAWMDGVLPGTAPSQLPVAGRYFVDYALEAAGRFGVEEAVMVDRTGNETLGRRFGVDRDGLCAVSTLCLAHALPRNLAELERQDWFRGSATSGAPIVVAWGQALPFYRPRETEYEPVPQDVMEETPIGVYHMRAGRWYRPTVPVAAIRDAASWLDLSLRLLGGDGGYTLPGYSAENGVHLCRNVVMEHGTDARPPVLMLDNVWCARDVRLEGGVILGRNAFVGRGAHLSRTMVCDDTYVGEWLELDGKIVVGGRIIDAATGAWVDVEERGIVRGGPGGLPKWLTAALRFVAGRSAGRGSL